MPPPHTQHHFARLLGDVGGTHARFALQSAQGTPPARIRTLACGDYPDIESAVRAYLQLESVPIPEVASIGIANPVTTDQITMTNHHWHFSVEALRAALGLRQLLVLNDFTALALAVPQLREDEREQIGTGEAVPGATVGVLGAGTGLGVSGLVWCGENPVPLAGEGGHVTLAASTNEEARLIAHLQGRFQGHVSAERVLSGPGLMTLYETLSRFDHTPAETLTSAQIGARALAGSCPVCVRTLNMFCALLGTVAGDLALTLGARGGIYLGGGIVPKLGAFFGRSPFRQRFEQKGRFSAYLADIPTYVISAPYPALTGAAQVLDRSVPTGISAIAPSPGV